MKYFVMLAAVLAMNARPLSAINTKDESLPGFGDINIENAGDIAVPDPGIPASVETPSGDTDINSGDQNMPEDTNYSFDIPVNDIGDITEVLDSGNNFLVRATKNGYGNYTAEIIIDGYNATFNIAKTSADRYLVRGDEVNLTVTRSLSGDYYDVSGDIPTPQGEMLNLRLYMDAFGTMTACDNSYDFTLRRDRVSGGIDSSLFSKADVACVIALSMAIRRDVNQQDPAWQPYVPEPWYNPPYYPDPYHPNPWHHSHPFHPGPGPIHPGPGPVHPQPPINPGPIHPQPPINPGPVHPVNPFHPQPAPQPQPPVHPVNPFHPQPAPQPQPPVHPVNPQPVHPQPGPGNHGGFGGHK